jgi:thiamine pyrophosphate-dependent acetolactate synthase large subunit-like protein
MKRAEAIAVVCRAIDDGVIVAANGMISRETFACAPTSATRFYMLGSMGLAAPIALGIAIADPHVPVTVLDGDGSILMNLGALAMVGAAKQRRFVHVVLDNESYDSTGGQPSLSRDIPLDDLALTCGYARAIRVDCVAGLAATLPILRREPGPHLLLVKVQPGASNDVPRIHLEPEEIAASVRRMFVSLDVARETY